jgi:hypothetical protein
MYSTNATRFLVFSLLQYSGCIAGRWFVHKAKNIWTRKSRTNTWQLNNRSWKSKPLNSNLTRERTVYRWLWLLCADPGPCAIAGALTVLHQRLRRTKPRRRRRSQRGWGCKAEDRIPGGQPIFFRTEVRYTVWSVLFGQWCKNSQKFRPFQTEGLSSYF